uniref:Uncharacterized protein n=1 Tax=Leersia perrieri TaxID=77586 RepID=A0A0D9VEC1_9ORYZ
MMLLETCDLGEMVCGVDGGVSGGYGGSILFVDRNEVARNTGRKTIESKEADGQMSKDHRTRETREESGEA